MLINSEFVIEKYTGRLPLPLLSAPNNLDLYTSQQYNNFIASVNTIYGSQNPDGTIPTFFKNADGSPSENSTLTTLQTDQEYYFISRNFPYSIPAIGGSSASACSGLSSCCATVGFVSPTVSLSGPPENTYAYIRANVSGLTPGKSYSYQFSSVAANWPSKVSPLSGTIIASSNNDIIDSVFSFCPDSGNCEGYWPCVYDVNSKKNYVQKNIFSTFSIKLLPPTDSECPVMADDVTVKCNMCLPDGLTLRPEVNIIGAPKISLSTNCCSNPVPVNINVSGAEPGKTYSFNIECWPQQVTANPASGNISFGDGIGRISTILDMTESSSSVIKVSINDPISGENFVDFASLICNTTC